MINVDHVIGANTITHNPNWQYIPNHPYRNLIIGGSGSGKTNTWLILINHQADIDEIYLYPKDPHEAKYQFLINKHEKVGLKHYGDQTFIEYSNYMQDVYKNIDEYNPDKRRKRLIIFDDIIADLIRKKNTESKCN